ncbi:sulfatase-like hydrolase/transferase [Verrucomicrobiaceae bacterium N1E253]|uniref:Sulfatase-like hydrolase/transferase n=1 Tax=Oceaniferula marina TaxID=2748318 RepID=A0A851GG49_9BACT|nr:sulfatase-like hydrolase/transferase [Oceaniferula marina]NWK54137.1 sulfatase-like hydrolase/transferase [Oceaniferula marina]
MNVKRYLLVGAMVASIPCAVAEKPNVVVIVADDMGYGDLGFTGHPHIKTPHLDALSKGGASFQHFYSPAQVCSPTRAAMMTGRMPHRHGIYSFIGGSSGNLTHLPKKEVTLPQLLRKNGYQTAIIGKWHCSLLQVQMKNDQIPSMDHYGFDYWFCSDDNAKILDKPGWLRNGKSEGAKSGLAANVVGKEAVHWLKNVRNPEKPFIQFVHFYEPHWYVEAPKEDVQDYLKAATANRSEAIYFGAITNVDREVGRITGALKELGLIDNTLILFSSDHGPAKLGKGKADRNYGTATPYRGNKYGLWDGSIHVPGIAHWPSKVKAGLNVTTPAGSIDWLPTICEVTGTALPGSLELDGQSFYSLLQGKKMLRKKPLQWHHYNTNAKNRPNPNAVLRRGDYVICGFYDPETQLRAASWKVKHIEKIKNGKLVKFALYDITKDPQQTKDIATSEPQLFKAMLKELVESHQQYQKEAVGWNGVTPVYP